MKTKRSRIIFALCTLAIMIMIFCFSAQNGDDSSNTSDPITKIICSIFYVDFEGFSEVERFKIVGNISFLVRKTAHFFIYFLLGASTLLTVLTFNKIGLYVKPILSLSFCVLYAASDEVHQYFVPGRSCELRDALIDICGALLSTVLIMLFSVKFKKEV